MLDDRCFLMRSPGEGDYAAGRETNGDSDRAAGDVASELERHEAFLFSDFSLNPGIRYIRRDTDISLNEFDECARRNDSFRYDSTVSDPFKGETTLREDHIDYVNRLKRRISEIESESGHRAKIIAARIKTIDTNLSASEIFLRLCKAYPSAFVYAFSTPETGTWVGATPETLLRATGADSAGRPGTIETMSLAGTRPTTPSTTDLPWGAKEVEEQQIVTDFIADTLTLMGYTPCMDKAVTKKCGPVEHISTRITAPRLSAGKQELVKLLRTLSPTPALCGYPRQEAMQEILANEPCPREYYGGLVGVSIPDNPSHHDNPMRSDTPYSLIAFANLRCGSFNSAEGKLRLYAGGGITRSSDPVSEWDETEAKLTTMTLGIRD